MANVRACNRSLYRDLVETGLLRKRGGGSTIDDEWLSDRPRYRSRSADIYLLEEHREDVDSGTAFALWFRLPFENGKRPKKEFPWKRFEKKEGDMLEEKYRSVLKQSNSLGSSNIATAARTASGIILHDGKSEQQESTQETDSSWDSPKYATTAKWYDPDLDHDVLLDQKRHAVTFVRCISESGKQKHEEDREGSTQQVGENSYEDRPTVAQSDSGESRDEISHQSWEADRLFALPPPLLGLYRPTMWRSYGPDEVRRAVWFVDTPRNGLQPYGEDAQASLEDAYQFLKWKVGSKHGIKKPSAVESSYDTDNGDGSCNENVLLTVQVTSPDCIEQQLVQFTSLTLATAIGKGIGGAISLFKRRVYRGAYNYISQKEDEISVTTECEREDASTKACEQSRWTTSTEDALEKLRLTISPAGPTTKTEMEEADLEETDIDIEYKECFKDLDEEQETPKTALDVALNHSDHPQSTSSKNRPCVDEISLAFPLPFSKIDADDLEADHLILVIHGIGEMMQVFDLFGLKKVPTIVDCCGYLRGNHAEISNARVAKTSQSTNSTQESKKAGRVEYLPIEWHEAFSIQSTRRSSTELIPPSTNKRSGKVSVDDISLRTIPTLRSFANDTLMDILYFMSPAHHDVIIDIVSFELNFVVQRFRKLTGFKSDISIIGHSIGSVIAWDILDHQQQTSSIRKSSMTDSNTTWTGASDSYQYPQLNFKVGRVYLLGSPVPVFLMIRNQEKPLTTSFTLNGCPRVFNIFHPYDPVSYRIEPLIHPRNSEIEPDIITHWNGGFRFQYQTKRIWKKIVDQTLRAEENVIHSIESGIEALGLVDSGFSKNLEKEDDSGDTNDQETERVLITGSLNVGRRIDYMLQEKEIDRANEYVAALAAHSCYWLEKDLSLFIENEICLEKEMG
mmetsp:Transcript_3427/g.9095  ORF Transcript_3427/g.9095 Transcript_3427/m.9095 type:complete len:908 (-) Transcript_3427:234-2957(-)